MTEFWTWLTETDAGLLARIATGASVLLVLAVADLRRRGRAATRWREYAFLLGVVATAIAYAILNDQVTCAISWEYFYNHDDSVAQAIGPLAFDQSPDPWSVRLAAVRMAAKGAWTAGLGIGVVLLIANNPSKRRPQLPQLPYRRLYRLAMIPLIGAILLSALMGTAGYLGLFAPLFEEMLRFNVFRPARFMAVFGAHLGVYAGGILGTVWAVIALRRQRAKECGMGIPPMPRSPTTAP